MKNFIAVLVLYNIDLSKSETFMSLNDAMQHVDGTLDLVIYDNSPVSIEPDPLTSERFNITYIHDPANPGVSTAYNVAAEIGRKLGKEWLILFDQDTTFPDDILKTYVNTISIHPGEKLFAPLMITGDNKAVSPCRFSINKGFSTTNFSTGKRSLDGHSLINCGLCIKLEAFYKINGYDPEFKLDYSDHDFVSRYKKNINSEVVVLNTRVKHMLSAKQLNSLESDQSRFIYFRDALRRYSMIHGGRLYSNFNILLRGLKLSMMHRTANFLKLTFS